MGLEAIWLLIKVLVFYIPIFGTKIWKTSTVKSYNHCEK